MTSYELLKICHACSALLSVAGFALRSFWLMTHNPLLGTRLTKILPHCLDTLLLGTAIALLWQLQISPFALDWVSLTIGLLLLYIGLGMVAMRFGRTYRQRVGAATAALLVAGYMICVAFTKSVWGPLALLSG